jgi:hypothetical protein
MSVQPLTSFDPHRLFYPGARHEAGLPRLDTRISGLSIAQEFSGRVNVTTAEGDRVTLVADVDDAYEAGAVQSFVQTRHGDGFVGAGYARSAHAHHVGVSIQGDLNEAEVTDLEKLFERVSNIFRGFFQGHDDEARAHTENLADGFHGLENLSGLDLSVEIVRSVAVVSGSGSTPGGAPGTAAAIPQSSNGTTAPTPSGDTSDGVVLKESVQNGQLASLIQQVFNALKEAEAELPKFQTYLAGVFEKLHHDLLKEIPPGHEHQAEGPDLSVEQGPEYAQSLSANSNVVIAYSSVHLTAFSFSLQG